MTEEAKLAADTLRKMANFKQFLAFPQDTGRIINACADLIESLSAQLEQVTRERDAAVEELSYTRKCSICKKHLSEGGDCYGNHKCGNGNPDWQWRGVEVE